MSDGLFTLIFLCAAMGITSFGAGMIPLHLALSKSNMRRLSSASMGILVGTALIVVIPEGADVLYKLGSPADDNGNIQTPTTNKLLMTRHLADDTSNAEKGGYASSAHRCIGIALASGFVLMYLIDQLPKVQLPSHANGYSLVSLRRMRSFSEQLEDVTGVTPSLLGKSPLSIGLVIHAAADGVALGSASSSNNTPLELIVFFSLVLHKAPVALGFAALIKESQSKRQAKTNLLIFSAAAPIAALITWCSIYLIGHSGPINQTSMTWWTGNFLIFSGGTFLYVAIHSMQEHSQHGDGTSTHDNAEMTAEQKTSLTDIFLFVGGMLFPSVIELGGRHH